jgi:hypothetical protein
LKIASPHAIENISKARFRYKKLRWVEIGTAIDSALIMIDDIDVDARTGFGHDYDRRASDIAGANTTDTIPHEG